MATTATPIDAVQVQSLATLSSPIIVLCIVPNFVGDVLVFEETWTLEPAIHISHPELRNLKMQFLLHKNAGFRSASARYANGRLSYDYHFSGHHERDYLTENFYVWNFFTGELLIAAGDLLIPPGVDPLSFGVIILKSI